MIRIPNEIKQFKQSNSTDRFGNIYRTKNISFDKKGYITVSPVTRMVATSEDLANLNTSAGVAVVGSTISQNNLWIYSDKNLYKTTVGLSSTFPTFTEDTESGTPVFSSSGGNGAINWDNSLIAADGTDVNEWNGSAWSVFNTFNADFVESFDDRNLIAVADTSEARVYDRAGNLIQTLLINSDLTITGIKWNNSRLYIGTSRTSRGGNTCLLIEWDSLANTASNQYWVNAEQVMAMTPFEQGIAFITNEGFLGYCYGGVQELDRLPIFATNKIWEKNAQNYKFAKVNTNGMTTDDGQIYISLDSTLNTTLEDNTELFDPTFPSGVWCYNREVGLHHKHSVGQAKCVISNAIATTDVNTNTNTITIGGVTVPETGTPCFYRTGDALTGTAITGLGNGIRYFTIKISDTTMKVATTRSNALAGTAISLTGTGNASQKITFHLESDFGGSANQTKSISQLEGSATRRQGSWLIGKFGIGATQQTGTGTSVNRATFSVTQSYLENRGWLITPKLESQGLEDNYATIALKWNKLKTEDQKIIVKYKTRDSDLDEYLTADTPYFTLTANNTLTTTQDLSGVEVGDEIEFVRGAGAGYLAHITSITENSGTYTVVFDEEIRNLTANERGLAVFTKWKKLQTITKDAEDNDFGYRSIRLAEKSKWAMFKIEIRGWDTSISDILIDNKPQKPISV